MAYTTINKSTDYFNTKLYTGNNSTQSITGVGHQPDFTWIKSRSGSSRDHLLFDVIRTPTKFLKSNSNSGEATAADTLTAFDSDGFSVGSNGGVNDNGETYASWNWKAGTGQGSSNTDGSINTTYTSVNTTAGFSISKYTGTSATATVGHGLGVVPQIVLIKCTSRTENWTMYHKSLNASGAGTYIYLNNTDAAAGGGSNTSLFNNTAPTSSVFSLGADGATNDTQTYMAYCFAEKTGYSKFGKYTGTGSADGPFIYTGFKPAFVIFKRTSGTGGWIIHDNKRSESNGGNPLRKYLAAHNNSAEGTDDYFTIDIVSNGFKLRSTDGESNSSGETYVYMAFGQSLVGSNNVPCTAR